MPLGSVVFHSSSSTTASCILPFLIFFVKLSHSSLQMRSHLLLSSGVSTEISFSFCP